MRLPKLKKITSKARAGVSLGERGAALAMTMMIMALIGVVTIAVMTVVSNEARISGSDLERTQTFYASASGLEKMTSDFSDLFSKTAHPVQSQLDAIALDPPDTLIKEGFTFVQTIALNKTLLDAQVLARGGKSPVATVPTGPFAGLIASVEPYHLTSVARHTKTSTQVRLERDVNNYMIPLFQFGTFSDKDLEFWPEPPMTFNGRVHANGNIYFGGDINFLDRVTAAGEAVRDKLRNNSANTTLVGGSYASNPRFTDIVSGLTAKMTVGSVVNGPNLTQPRVDGRGSNPGSPPGTDNTTWSTSTNALDGSNNHFGELLKTSATGARKLLLPLQLDGRQPYEIIKRSMLDDNTIMSQSRYQSKATVRILIDDEKLPAGVTSNAAGIPSNKGVLLSQWFPSELNGGNALRMVDDYGNYLTSTDWYQGDTTSAATKKKAMTVRGVRNDYWSAIKATGISAPGSGGLTGGNYAKTTGSTPSEFTQNQTNVAIPAQAKTTTGAIIPTGSGIKGRILIEIVDANGVARDVTQAVLSMGVTVGEPNAIVQLQRPLWAAFMQGSRDRTGGNDYLTYFMDNSKTDRRALADGEVNIKTGEVTLNSAGFLATTDVKFDDDAHSGASLPFSPTATTMARDDKPPMPSVTPCTPQPGCLLNQIVPINVYNVREGHITDTLTATNVYQRGITSVVELNMRNLARWLDGVYDSNLLSGTNAASGNIGSPDGWIVYFSDRRGDRPKPERDSLGAVATTTNGMVDNEDIYNYPASATATPEPGEDVIDDGYDVVLGKNKLGSLQRDTLELPDPVSIGASTSPAPSGYTDTAKYWQALAVGTWPTSSLDTPNTNATGTNFFRRALRLFNGENLQISGYPNKLSQTKGLTVASENMVYIWGNYNTTGITGQPTTGSTVNDPTKPPYYYLGPQVPASIAADAFFPISKTWFDSVSAMYPEGSGSRIADAGLASAASPILPGQETSVRAGIIAGTTQSAMVGTAAPTVFLQWLNGGVHNFPRFLETWGTGSTGWEKRWNYVGSYIILWNSTQAVGPWSVTNSVNYYPPTRNWAFDITFTDPNRLPPGTPQFQFIQATGFRQTILP
jgi:hypothetical protein